MTYSEKFFLFALPAILFSFSIFGEGTSDRESMDEVLQKELGVKTEQQNQKSTAENASTEKQEKKSEAQNPVQERYKSAEDDSPGILWLLVKVIFIFSILAAGMFYILKNISKTREARFPVKGIMNVLSALPLGTGKQLQIVDISGKILVLGISESSVNLVTEISSPEIKEKIFQMKENYQPPVNGFLVNLLDQLKEMKIQIPGGKIHPFSEESSEPEVVAEIKKRQKDRLEKLKSERASIRSDLDGPGLFGGGA